MGRAVKSRRLALLGCVKHLALRGHGAAAIVCSLQCCAQLTLWQQQLWQLQPRTLTNTRSMCNGQSAQGPPCRVSDMRGTRHTIPSAGINRIRFKGCFSAQRSAHEHPYGVVWCVSAPATNCFKGGACKGVLG